MKKMYIFKKTVLVILFLTVTIFPQQQNKGVEMSGQSNTQKEYKEQKRAIEKTDNVSNITVKDMNGRDVPLSDYKGKVLLIVNVASKCGFTPQYEALEDIYEKYKDQGFEVLAFPCNDFGGQEPGSNEEIKEFCSVNYGVKFKLFDKVKVLGPEKSPLYEVLTSNETTGKEDIKWNFEKFLISRDGKILARYGSRVKPDGKEITSAIEEQLKADKKS